MKPSTALFNGAVSEALDACPICGSGDFEPLFQVPFPYHSELPGEGFPLDVKLDVPAWRIVRCECCTVRYPNPFPTKEAIVRYYADQEEPNEYEKKNYIEVPERALEACRLFARNLTILNGGPGSILEIGCAAGWVLDALRDCGWDAYGIEASPKFQKFAVNELKLDVRLGTLDEVDFGTLKFDIVVNTDVIEHLHDPVGDLGRIRSMMKPGGHLVMATCDIGSFCASFWGLAWRQIVISHTFYWTKRSMAIALERAGFHLESFSEPRYWHPHWIEEQKQKLLAFGKLAARLILLNTYRPASMRYTWVRRLPGLLTSGKVDHTGLLYRIGGQPVLGDVMLVVAKPY